MQQQKWEKENGNYEVNFKQEGKSISAIIMGDGTIVETETVIPIRELPANVRSYAKDHYNDAIIKESSKIEKVNGDLNFEALVNGKDIMFDANGQFIQEAQD